MIWHQMYTEYIVPGQLVDIPLVEGKIRHNLYDIDSKISECNLKDIAAIPQSLLTSIYVD